MSMALGSKLELVPGSWTEAVYEVSIGMIVGVCHAPNLISRWWIDILSSSSSSSSRTTTTADIDANRTNGAHTDATTTTTSNELKVVAVGYGRTGTYSLTLALEELGYPTLHTQHLYEHTEIISMWTNTIFLPSIQNGVASLGQPDFDLIARKFSATADLPMALYYEQVLARYPNCKFILTERDSPEQWFRSWNTLTSSITEATNLGGFVFTNCRRYIHYLRWISAIVNQDNTYLLSSTATTAPQQPQRAMASYIQHNARVRATIPAEQLLVYNVREGWAPLCAFLQNTTTSTLQCPTTPFPKTNSARSVQVQAVSGLLINLMVVLFLLFSAVAHLFQRCTGRTILQYVWGDSSSRRSGRHSAAAVVPTTQQQRQKQQYHRRKKAV